MLFILLYLQKNALVLVYSITIKGKLNKISEKKKRKIKIVIGCGFPMSAFICVQRLKIPNLVIGNKKNV